MTKLRDVMVVALIIVLAIVNIVLIKQKKSEPASTTSTEIDTVRVTNTVHTKLIRDNVVTVYDTVFVDTRPYIIARYHDTIDTTKVRVDLDIAYSEYDKLFDVRADVAADIDTVFITKTITNTIVTEKPYKTIALISGINTMFAKNDGKMSLDNVGIDIGARIVGKYDIALVGTTDETFGLRFGISY